MRWTSQRLLLTLYQCLGYLLFLDDTVFLELALLLSMLSNVDVLEKIDGELQEDSLILVSDGLVDCIIAG